MTDWEAIKKVKDETIMRNMAINYVLQSSNLQYWLAGDTHTTEFKLKVDELFELIKLAHEVIK